MVYELETDESEHPFENAAQNPYQASLLEEPESLATLPPSQLSNYLWSFGKWSLVCILSAVPSFFWGCVTVGAQVEQILGMVSGIATFIVGYVIVEQYSGTQRLLSLPHIRLTSRIGYGTRIAISIIFPVGMMLDLWLGLLSTSITGVVFGDFVRGIEDGARNVAFLPVYFTTIVQGILLNFVLLCYMSVVWFLVWGIHTLAIRRKVDLLEETEDAAHESQVARS